MAASSGRSWQYLDDYLINEFVGRVGHTPAWIVEVEGLNFVLPPSAGGWMKLRTMFRKPRVIQRNRRRLAFAWPLRWPPPVADERDGLRHLAVAMARQWGRPPEHGCGVCTRTWNGGPTFVAGRARHLCPECAERIASEQEHRPPGSLSTWLWCLVAGMGGLLAQLLLHQTFSWMAGPAALFTGWLMGLANGPNFERRPVVAPLLTLTLVLALQTVGLVWLTGMQLGAAGTGQLTAIFLWTVGTMPIEWIIGLGAGSAGIAMALVEQRLRRA